MDQTSDEIKEKEIGTIEPDDSAAGSAANNRVWFLVVIALIFGGFIGWVVGRQSGLAQAQSSSVADSESSVVVTATALPTYEAEESELNRVAIGPTPASIVPDPDRTLGDAKAPVTIVEFSDYQCPFCQQHFQETLPLLKENYIDTGRVSYVFKDFPIASLHPLAYRLHEAALCVTDNSGADGYWQAHDLFFSNADGFQVDSLAVMDAAILAAFEGAQLPDVSTCLQSNKFAEAVRGDLSEGQSLGVSGTPAFFINGYPVTGAQPYELFEYAIGLAE